MRNNGAIRLSLFTRGFGRWQDDRGVYAILYAILIVVMIAMAGFALDISAAREDRRLDKSASDSAVLAALQSLDPNSAAGLDPYSACQGAWKYLANSLPISDHSQPAPGACKAFQNISPSTYCADAPPYVAPILVTTPTENDYTIQIEWPVPRYESDGITPNPFLASDLAPKTSANNQAFSTTADGTNAGCDRFGVAIGRHRDFGISSAIGMDGTTTLTHSVARVNPNGGPLQTIAALNVLDPRDCNTLTAGGGGNSGQIIVGPAVDDSGDTPVAVSPGVIAVESAALTSAPWNGTCSGANAAAVVAKGNANSVICTSSQLLTLSCDGKGTLASYAMTTGGAVSSTTGGASIKSNFIAEPSQYGWAPVTKLYGCQSLPQSPMSATGTCPVSGTNYIKDLYNALQGSAGLAPTKFYTDSVSPYAPPPQYNESAAVWKTAPAPLNTSGTCTVNGNVTVDPLVVGSGYIYVPCNSIQINGTLTFLGGTIVVEGGITIANGGCLMVNVPTTTGVCLPGSATSFTGTRGSLSTNPAPNGDTVMYLRNNNCSSGNSCGITTKGGNTASLWMPQTFVYSAGSGLISLQATPATADGGQHRAFLWTAPGTGTLDANGHTPLENRCWDQKPADSPNADCLNSRFSRVMYWSEYAAPTNKPNFLGGQGTVNYAGVLFTPQAAFTFTGGSGGTAAAAQFWANILNVNGGGSLVLQPDERFAFTSPTSSFALIR